MLSIQSKNDCPAETVYADGCVSVCVSLCLMVISRMYTHKHTYTIHIFISIHSVYVYISCCCSMRSCQRDHNSRRAGKWCGKQCCTPPLFMSDGYPIINTSPCRWNTHIICHSNHTSKILGHFYFQPPDSALSLQTHLSLTVYLHNFTAQKQLIITVFGFDPGGRLCALNELCTWGLDHGSLCSLLTPFPSNISTPHFHSFLGGFFWAGWQGDKQSRKAKSSPQKHNKLTVLQTQQHRCSSGQRNHWANSSITKVNCKESNRTTPPDTPNK